MPSTTPGSELVHTVSPVESPTRIRRRSAISRGCATGARRRCGIELLARGQRSSATRRGRIIRSSTCLRTRLASSPALSARSCTVWCRCMFHRLTMIVASSRASGSATSCTVESMVNLGSPRSIRSCHCANSPQPSGCRGSAPAVIPTPSRSVIVSIDGQERRYRDRGFRWQGACVTLAAASTQVRRPHRSRRSRGPGYGRPAGALGQALARSSAASNHGSLATAYSSVVAMLVASSVFIVA